MRTLRLAAVLLLAGTALAQTFTTTAAVTSNENPTYYLRGDLEYFATLSAHNAAGLTEPCPADGAVVTFYDNGAVLGTNVTINCQALIQTTYTTPALHAIYAVYAGNS